MVIAAKDVNKNVSPLRSTHSVVAIVDIGTAKKSLLVPIEITAERKVNGARMDVNTISSVYEKSVKSLVTEAIAQENAGDIGIFYAKKEAMTLPGAGVQFPVQLQQSIASNGIIHRFSEKVNMNISEMVCDAMGEMNTFATEETSTVAGEVGQFLRDLRKAALETQTDGQKNNAPEGVKFSRELTTDGRVVAVVDEDILSNLDLSNWNQETKEAAQKAAAAALLKFQDGIAVEGITRKVNRISRKEFTRSEYTNELFWWNSTAFLDKMRAANNLDDVVIATTDWARDGKLKHPRTDNFVDFDHGTTLIASGDAKYEAEVVVGITDKGAAVFYDIVNMQPGNFSIKNEEPSTTATTNKSPGDIHEGSSEARVAQQEQNVKQKYSRELDSEYMELAKDPEGNSTELRKMVDQAAEQQGYKTLFYHGSKKGGGFTEFRDWQYFTPKKEYAERYAQRGNPDSLYSVFVKMENPFDTRNAKARRIFQKARGELGLSEIQSTGLPDWTDGYDLADYIDENGLNYDAIVLDEGGDLVNGKPVSRGFSYVVRKSNQVKSADAVVYDDNGKVIPLSERFNSDKRDIRYSRELETVEALKRQNEILQKQRDYWKEQTRTTDEKTRGADKGEVRSLAGQLIRQYSSKTEVEEILPEMQWLADSIWRNDPKISYTDLQDSAQNIARMVLDGSEVNLNAENWETGQELKRFLRGRYINVDEGLKEDIGDFKAFKQSNRSLHFRENGTGTGVASLWLELQNDFGKGLFPDSISNHGDQIRHIADTLTSLTESDMRNPYAADMELTVEQMAYDVMARAAGLNRQKATKADQAVERATEELNRLLKAGRTRERARIEQNQQTTYRQQIKNVSEKFQRMLLRPGKGATQHAPANLVGAVRSFCELFNDSEMRRAARWQLTLDTFFNYVYGCI